MSAIDPLGREWACVTATGSTSCRWYPPAPVEPCGLDTPQCWPGPLPPPGQPNPPGGGGGGGVLPRPPAPGKPSIWTRIKGWASSELSCTDQFADKYSIAGGLHALGIGNGGGLGGLITNALGGNIVSGLIETVAHPSESASSALLLGGGTDLGFGGDSAAERGLGGEALDLGARGFWSAVTGAGQTITTLSGEASLASTGITASSFAYGVGEAKLAYDGAAFVTGLLACGVN